MDLLTGYRLLVEAALAGANVTVLVDEFNKALESGGSLGPDFGVLAQRLAEEARWSFFCVCGRGGRCFGCGGRGGGVSIPL